MQIEFGDKTVDLTFDSDDAVDVYDAIAFVTTAMEAAGAELAQDFVPQEQLADDGKLDNDYVRADLRFEIPGVGRIWLEVECQHDGLDA